MAPTETGIILLAGVIIFSGHLVKGVSGFGSALFAVPLLMLILDVKFITPVFLIFDLMSGAILVASNYRSIHRRLLLLLLCGLLAGTAIGTWALLSFGHDALKRVLGLLVIGWASYALLRRLPPAAGDGLPPAAGNGNRPAGRRQTGRATGCPRPRGTGCPRLRGTDCPRLRGTDCPRPRGTGYLAPLSGFLGGALGAMFSVNGPPIIIYLAHVIEEKQPFRATLYGIFFADACYKVVLFTANGLLNGQVLRFALLMAPFLLAGTFAGSWLQRTIDQALFKKIVALILLVTGAVLLI